MGDRLSTSGLAPIPSVSPLVGCALLLEGHIYTHHVLCVLSVLDGLPRQGRPARPSDRISTTTGLASTPPRSPRPLIWST